MSKRPQGHWQYDRDQRDFSKTTERSESYEWLPGAELGIPLGARPIRAYEDRIDLCNQWLRDLANRRKELALALRQTVESDPKVQRELERIEDEVLKWLGWRKELEKGRQTPFKKGSYWKSSARPD